MAIRSRSWNGIRHAPGSRRPAWEGWERRGVNQFRLLHFFQPRYREMMEANAPDVVAALLDAGALLVNPFRDAPAEVTGGFREGDERHDAVTARSAGCGSRDCAGGGGRPTISNSAGCRSGWPVDRRYDRRRRPACRWGAHRCRRGHAGGFGCRCGRSPFDASHLVDGHRRATAGRGPGRLRVRVLTGVTSDRMMDLCRWRSDRYCRTTAPFRC